MSAHATTLTVTLDVVSAAPTISTADGAEELTSHLLAFRGIAAFAGRRTFATQLAALQGVINYYSKA